MGFDLQSARKEYSDTEIAEYLARNRAFDLKGARKEGWTDAEIADYLNARDVVSREPALSDPGPRAGRQPGLQVQGNIDTRNRPQVRNADGSTSTVRSMSFEDDQGREILIPTVSEDGRVMSDAEAIKQYQRTGRHLGMFDTPQNATGFAQRLHEDQARRLSKPSPHTVPESETPLSKAFDPYGGYYNPDRGMARAPDDYGVTIGESLGQSLGEGFQTPSGEDWWNSLRGTLARVAQGYELNEYESLEDEVLGRTWPMFHNGMPKYSRSPEELRNLQDDPLLVAAQEGAAQARAAGREITAEGQDISSRNQGYWPQVVMSATNSLAASAPALAATMVTKNPLTSLPMMYGPTAASSYGEMREQGVPRGLADKASTVEGIIEAATEFPAMRPFAAEASPFMRRFGETLAADVPGETIATLGQDLTRQIATADPNADTFDTVAEGLRQGLGELPVTYGTVLATAGAHAALGHGIQATQEALRDRSSEIAADATRDRALASAQDLLDRIRGPQGRLPFDGMGSPPGAPPPQGPPGLGAPPSQQPGIDMSLLSSVVPHDPFAPELPMRDPTIQPELPIDTIAPPDTTGSPAPEAGGGMRTAPIPPSTQGTATPAAQAGAIPPGETPLSSAFQQPASVAPPASPSPKEPAPTPAPHAAPAVSTAKEPPAGGATSLDALRANKSATVRRYEPDVRGGEPTTKDAGPAWDELPAGWRKREYVAEIDGKRYPVQEIRTPGGKRYTRGTDLDGKPFALSPAGNELFNKFFDEPAPATAMTDEDREKKARDFDFAAEEADESGDADAAAKARESAAQIRKEKPAKEDFVTKLKRSIAEEGEANVDSLMDEYVRLVKFAHTKKLTADVYEKVEDAKTRFINAARPWVHSTNISDSAAAKAKLKAKLTQVVDDMRRLLEPQPAQAAPAKPAKAAPPKQSTLFDEEGKPAEGATQTEPTPPVQSGFVRMYHGGVDVPTSGGGRWVTYDKTRAQNYRDGATLYYIDIPKGDPTLKKSFEDEGTSIEAPPVDFELSEDRAKQLRQYVETAREPTGGDQVTPQPKAEAPAQDETKATATAEPDIKLDGTNWVRAWQMDDGRWNAAFQVSVPNKGGTFQGWLGDDVPEDQNYATREEAIAAAAKKIRNWIKNPRAGDKKAAARIGAWLDKSVPKVATAKPAAETPAPAQVEPTPAPKAKGKPFKLPEPPPIKTKGAKRSSKVEADLAKQTDEFQKLWADHKRLTSQWKSDDLPAAVASEVSKVGLGLQYLKSADTFRQYTGELTRLNRWLEEANSAMESYEPPAPPTKRTADQEARAKTLDDLIGDPTTLRLRDGMNEARDTVKNPQTVFRSFWKNTFPKLNARAKEYVQELADSTTYGSGPRKGESMKEFIARAAKDIPIDTHPDAASLWKYVSFMQFADQYLNGKRELPAVRVHKRGDKEPSNKYESLVPRGEPIRDQAPVEPMEGEIVPLPTTEEKFGEVIDDYAGLFEDPDVKVNATDNPDYTGFISEKAARKRVLAWERQAEAQAKTSHRLNADKVIFSLFDLTQSWSQPYIDAGYTVIPLDLQTGTDILDLSVSYLHENFPDISDVHGILIAAPCTDFTLAGNRHMKAKDESGKTELSKELVFQAMRLVDYYKPTMWVLENPAYSYVEDAAGLPKARYEFQPYDFGDPYTKRTQLWGNFNTDLPVAPVYPRLGSVMWSDYGGKSQATKNARSATPKGFAYSFFLANNVADASPHERLTAEFPDAAGAIEKSLEAGFTEQQIRDTIEGIYEADDAKEARAELRKLVKTGEPEGEPQELPKPVKREQTKRAKFALAAEREVQAKLKHERDVRLGRAAPDSEVETDDIEDDEVTSQDDDVGAKAAEEKPAKKQRKAASKSGVESAMDEGTEEAADTEGSSRFKRQDEQIITPSTARENLMNELGIDPTEFRLKGGQEQWEIAAKAIKEKYGYAGVFKHPRQTWRNAVDHLLDGFESLQNMANAMGQGNRIVSLNGRVSLYMREKPGKTKGYFRHRGGLSGEPNNTIAVFNQEDVYSHELGHAIDYDLMERAGGAEPGGLSRMIRTRENTSALPNTLQEATADLMTALYYDGAQIAQLIKKAEHQLEKAGTEKRRAELTKRLKNLRSGAWTGRGAKTQFYLRAKNGPLADYLSKPTELFARAFEAYISWKIQYQNELGLVKFLGATDAVYRDEADAWIARTYPQAEERQRIFSAFDNLLGQLARENLYDTKGNPGWAKSNLNIGLMDPVAQAKAEGTALTPDIVRAHNLTQAAAETFVEDQIKLNDTLGKNWDQLVADLTAGKAGAADKFHAAMKAITSTPDGIMAFLERRYPNLPSLREMRNQLSDAAIHGRNKPIGVYREIQRQEASVRNRLEDRLKAVGIYANMPAKWSERMWDILHGYEKPANDLEKRQADQIRYELDYLWKLRDQTGEKIGYIDYEYLPRSFLRNIADDPRFHRDLLKLRTEEKQALIEKLEEQFTKAKTEEQQKALRAKIKAAEALNVRKMTAEQVGRMKGMKWGEPVYLGALSEDSAKERVFGPLADKILKDYYVKDPFTLLAGYGGAAARGMVMRRRFGENPNTVFQGWLDQAAMGLPSAYADILLNAMQTSLGVRRDGNSTLARAVSAYANVQVASMLGRSVLPNISEPLNILKSSFNSLNTFGSLVKAAMPAIFLTNTTQERYEAADRFGRLSGALVDAASSTTAMAQAMGEDVQGNGILARFSMRAYYFNLLSGLTAWQEKVVNRVGFEMFYEAARIVRKGGKDAGMYRQWLREHGIRDADAFAAFLKDNRQLDGINFEKTIQPGSMELALSNALDHFGKTTIQKPTPSTKHIQAHNGLIGIMYRLTSWMTTNFINWAAYMKDKMMSGISGRYGAEVVPLGKRLSVKGEYDGKKLTVGERLHGRIGGEQLTMGQRVGSMMMPVAASALAMYAAQATFLVARMMLTHHDEWEDRGEDFWERFSNPKTQLQILQYWGGIGWLMSTAIDTTEATRFNRGVTGTLLGPVYGGTAQDAERMIRLGLDQYAVSQGDKLPSVAVRNNAAQAVYHQASVLTTVGLLSVLPLKNPASRVVGLLWSFFGTSPQAQHEFADFVAGEKDTVLKKESESGTAKERSPARREIEQRRREKERFNHAKESRERQENRQ